MREKRARVSGLLIIKPPVGGFIPALIVFDAVIVDTKTIDRIGNLEIARILNYLQITKLLVGFIINFKQRRIETRRVIL